MLDADDVVRMTPRGDVAQRRGAAVGSPFSPTPAAPERIEAGAEPEMNASETLKAMAEGGAEDRSLAKAQTALRRVVKRGRAAAAKRADQLHADLADGAQADTWREHGELLRGSFHLLKQGARAVRVPDYTQDPPTEIEIELDPTLSPGDQVARCFTKARKLETAALRAAESIEAADAVRKRLADALVAIDEAADIEALEAIASGLPKPVGPKARGALAQLTEGPGAKRVQAPRRPYRTFRSLDGWEIRVGKSARDSDELTMRGARGHDLFLHIRSVPGAHVIVPTERGKTVPKETLLDAAELACLYSKRSEATANEVDYVERRYVRKPRGAKPGLVVLERSKTLSIRRDDDRRRRLKDRRGLRDED